MAPRYGHSKYFGLIHRKKPVSVLYFRLYGGLAVNSLFSSIRPLVVRFDSETRAAHIFTLLPQSILSLPHVPLSQNFYPRYQLFQIALLLTKMRTNRYTQKAEIRSFSKKEKTKSTKGLRRFVFCKCQIKWRITFFQFSFAGSKITALVMGASLGEASMPLLVGTVSRHVDCNFYIDLHAVQF